MKKNAKRVVAASRPVSRAYSNYLFLLTQQKKALIRAQKACAEACLAEVHGAENVLSAIAAFNMVCLKSWWTPELLILLTHWLGRCKTAAEARAMSEAVSDSLPREHRYIAVERWNELALLAVEEASSYKELADAARSSPEIGAAGWRALEKMLSLVSTEEGLTYLESDSIFRSDFTHRCTNETLRVKRARLRQVAGTSGWYQ